jgi:major membrane immunogen (membrane-anchored lipoprotein)
MNKFKYPAIAGLCFILLGAGIGLDIWFQPHRDVKSAPVFVEFGVDDFTSEFIDHPLEAKEKYLADDGDSKIVTMSGKIAAIETNLKGETVIELRGKREEAGVRFTLMEDQKEQAAKLVIGDSAKITGVVSAGAVYDEDFGRYLNAILEQAFF